MVTKTRVHWLSSSTNLPFVRHPEHEEFHEEDWLFEGVVETYIPLLQIFRRLASERVPVRLTLTMTPTLCAMLRDPLLQHRTERYLDRGIELSRREVERTTGNDALNQLAHFYSERFLSARDFYLHEIRRDVVGAFAQLQEDGILEIITCAATHGFLPLMEFCPEAMRAQIFVGRDQTANALGVIRSVSGCLNVAMSRRWARFCRMPTFGGRCWMLTG